MQKWRKSKRMEEEAEDEEIFSLKQHLLSLTFEACPFLLERCRRGTGKDWPKIARIPRFGLNEFDYGLKIGEYEVMFMDDQSAKRNHLLKSLSLDYIHDLRSLSEEGLRNLTSLRYLSISRSDRLQTLSRGIYHLSALQELYVGELHLRTDKKGMHWKALKCLVSLKFWYLPELKSQPSALQLVTTLRKLEISHCSSLMAIPEWIQNWTSPEQFAIERCGSLTRLPEGMRCLTSLQSLKIRECPLLFRRCQRDEGEDWLKIAHIPKLDLK